MGGAQIVQRLAVRGSRIAFEPMRSEARHLERILEVIAVKALYSQRLQRRRFGCNTTDSSRVTNSSAVVVDMEFEAGETFEPSLLPHRFTRY
jgi:hypothetical protein